MSSQVVAVVIINIYWVPGTVLSSLCLLSYYTFTIIYYYSKFVNEEIEIQRAYIKNVGLGFEPRPLSF